MSFAQLSCQGISLFSIIIYSVTMSAWFPVVLCSVIMSRHKPGFPLSYTQLSCHSISLFFHIIYSLIVSAWSLSYAVHCPMFNYNLIQILSPVIISLVSHCPMFIAWFLIVLCSVIASVHKPGTQGHMLSYVSQVSRCPMPN